MKSSLIILFGLLYFYSYSQEAEVIVSTKIKILNNSKAYQSLKDVDDISERLLRYSPNRYDSKIVCQYEEFNWDTSSVKEKQISISFPTIFNGFKHNAYFEKDSATAWSDEAMSNLQIGTNRISTQWDTPFRLRCEKTKRLFEKFFEDVLNKMDEESEYDDAFLNIEDYLGTDYFLYNDEFGPADPRLHSLVWNGYLVLRSVGIETEYVEARLDKKTVKKLLKWLKNQDLTDSDGYSIWCD